MKRKVLSIVLATAIGMSTMISGVAVQAADETSVVVGISADPTSLAPWISNNGVRIGILPSIYQTLVQTESLGGEMKGVLMKDWEQIDDTIYNMTIYDSIYDTEGNHVTASDVAFSYKTGCEEGRYRECIRQQWKWGI